MTKKSTRLGNANFNPNNQGFSLMFGCNLNMSEKTIKRCIMGAALLLTFWGGFEMAKRQKQSQIQTQSQTQIANCNVGQATATIPAMTAPTTPATSSPPTTPVMVQPTTRAMIPPTITPTKPSVHKD